MGSNRYNKPTPQTVDYTPKAERKKEEEVVLIFKPCCICGGVVRGGYYGSYQEGGVCSRKCNSIREDMFLYLKDVP